MGTRESATALLDGRAERGTVDIADDGVVEGGAIEGKVGRCIDNVADGSVCCGTEGGTTGVGGVLVLKLKIGAAGADAFEATGVGVEPKENMGVGEA